MQGLTSQCDVDLLWVVWADLPGQRRLCERQIIAAKLELVEVHSDRRLNWCLISVQRLDLACCQKGTGLQPSDKTSEVFYLHIEPKQDMVFEDLGR